MLSYDIIMMLCHYDVTSTEHARHHNVHFGIRSHIGNRSTPHCDVVIHHGLSIGTIVFHAFTMVALATAEM